MYQQLNMFSLGVGDPLGSRSGSKGAETTPITGPCELSCIGMKKNTSWKAGRTLFAKLKRLIKKNEAAILNITTTGWIIQEE